MHHRGRIVSQSELTEHIYSQGFDRDSNTVEVFIARLRRKLGGIVHRNRARHGLSHRGTAVKSSVAARAHPARRDPLDGGAVRRRRHGAHAPDGQNRASAGHVPSHLRRTWTCSASSSWCASASGLRWCGAASLVRRAARAAGRGARRARARRLEGDYPAEVQPLVNDLNSLLDDREQRVTRALTKAGDLAHGLKTPLTVLNQQAERAKAAGQIELAAAITQQVERMRRQVDYHLAHARASASGGNPSARSHVLTSADGLARTMMTMHADRRAGDRRRRARTSTSCAPSARISTKCSAT